ncbi:hypothetical protein GCM10019060_33390 [Novosphingobium pokkalii]|nr:hypothetical protein GCM10019060_33390 [Novosphingobium pokkalii]
MSEHPAMEAASPWHRGEIALQHTVGVAAQMAELGRRVIRDHMIDQHRQFYEQLPFAVFGTIAPDGLVWASPRAGLPGFLSASDATHLRVTSAADPGDPAQAGLVPGGAVAMIGIEPATRRRNRLNGKVVGMGDGDFVIAVEESFGNCPQYIQQRSPHCTRDPRLHVAIPPQHLAALDNEARALIGQADSFFVASYAQTAQGLRADVSHRGGRPGFVRIDDDGTLTIPDFAGNQFFSTLGNISETGKAGLVFIDWSKGDVLQISGEAMVLLDSPETAGFQGAERLWQVAPQRIVRRKSALPLTWDLADHGWSPNLAATGIWAEARAKQAITEWRHFRIARIVDESRDVRSLHLEPADGGSMPVPLAGQHLPIRVALPDQPRPLVRSYTLSSAPGAPLYRISVKRAGRASRHLHSLAVGDVIEARAPQGSFTLDTAEQRPAVLLGAGIGITPMVAMARHLADQGARSGKPRRAWLITSAHSPDDQLFTSELAAIAQANQGAIKVLRVVGRVDPDGLPGNHDHLGRIDIDLLRRTLPFGDYDFYLCGPAGFMQDLYDGLRALNVAEERIHAEAFGPSALSRRIEAGAAVIDSTGPAEQPVAITFADASINNGTSAIWTPEVDNLLALAERSGLSPDYGCRSGQCGACRTRVLAGQVVHTTQVGVSLASDEALICCAAPAKESGPVTLQI